MMPPTLIRARTVPSGRLWGRGVRVELVAAVLVGVAAGLASVAMTARELRWTAYSSAAVVLTLLVLVARNRERLLSSVFILSLQISATYFLFYGKGGGDGLAFPLSALAGMLLALWWVVMPEAGGRRRFVWNNGLKWPIAAVLLTTIVALTTTDERFVGLGRLLFELETVLVFWLGLNIVRSETDLEWVVGLLLLSLGMQAGIYFVQSALGLSFTGVGDVIRQGEIPRPGGTVSTNPAGFASYIIPILCIAICRDVTSGSRRGNWLSRLGLIGMGITAVVLTFTRAAWAGIGIALTWILAVGGYRRVLQIRRLIPLLLVAVVAARVFFPTIMARLQESPLGDAYEERQYLNDIAVRVIADNPITGVGPGAYRYVYKAYIPPHLHRHWLYEVHNEYLLRTAETGIAGGMAFCWLLLAGLGRAVRLTASQQPLIRATALGWSAGLIDLAWQMYWVPWRGFEYNALLWLMLGITEAMARLEREAQERGSQAESRAKG